jgi:NAD-dependent deacetylase
MMNDKGKVNALTRLLRESDRTVIFTGAGMSTESGIPDFRSPGGIWTKMSPIEFSDFISSEEVRRESWRRKFAGGDKIRDARANDGHNMISRWVNSGKVSAVITQNVDGLHQQSGVPDSQVIELHGNTTYARCLDCDKRYELGAIRRNFEASGELPTCTECSGIIKTATISFGQSMPIHEMRLAETQTLACDLFIAIGSSLVVYPAAGFPALAKRNGAKLVIINREPTDLDPICDLVINSEIGATLCAVGDV